MTEFPHLKLPFKIEGLTKKSRGGSRNEEAKATTEKNKIERERHGEYLENSVNRILEGWISNREEYKVQGIELPNENDIPIFLRIDTEVFDIDSLKYWGIEVISEEENGFIIGASTDKLKAFTENINSFLTETGQRKDKAAQIWELATDDNWRLSQLLKGEIEEEWDKIENETIYTIELGVSCYIPNKKTYPNRKDFDSEQNFNKKVEEFKVHSIQNELERDKKQILRENEIEGYCKIYNGNIYDIWENEIDAIYFKIGINGKGLRDLVLTYQYLYEVKLSSSFQIEKDFSNLTDDYNVEVFPPAENAAKVCVIDSGIQENHRLIKLSIDSVNSRSYVDNDSDTADFVKQSGHGTKVAGAILFPNHIPNDGQYRLGTIIQNARILDRNNRISDLKFAPTLIEAIVSDYAPTRIFNLSVSEDSSYIGSHMPVLAASIDKLTHEKDILFIVAAGNVCIDKVTNYIGSGMNYPDYLDLDDSKVANPGISYFSLTVGSIGRIDYEDIDYKALAGRGKVSPFSRVGLGLWGCIKPDVVEFGGDVVKNKLSSEITTNESVSLELINSTMHGATAVGKDSFGTSFSTPKVSYIVSKLQNEHPDETAQMYRALIVQSARLPDHCFTNPTLNDFRYYGYGLPDLDRALSNSTSRITFIRNGNVSAKRADIYQINIPRELKGEGKEFRILIEVTLAFTSKTRLTRKGSHSYLANWLEWRSSRYNERFNSFRNRTIEYLEGSEDIFQDRQMDEGSNAIKWIIRENPAWSNNGINRNNSTVQKSWAIIEPQQFAEEFSLAVIGHGGWDNNLETETSYSLCISFEVLGSELNIYSILSQAQVQVETEQELEVHS